MHIDAVVRLAIEVISTMLARFLYGKMCPIDSAVDARKAGLLLPLLHVYSGFGKGWKANTGGVHM